MNYNKIVVGRADYAERQEVRDSEEQFAADVREILDGTIEDGVQFELGADKAALEKLLAVLGVDQDLENSDKGGYINYIKAIVGSGSGFGGVSPEVVKPMLKEYGFVTTLELLQANAWHTEEKSGWGERIVTAGGLVTSKLLLMNSFKDENGDDRTNGDSVAVVIAMTARMEVDVVTEHGYMSEDGVEDTFKKVQKAANHPREIARDLGRHLHSMDESLIFPTYHFSVRIGKCLQGGMFSGIIDVRADSNYYDLVGGRFIRDMKRSGDEEDEVYEEPQYTMMLSEPDDDESDDWRDERFHDLDAYDDDDDYGDEGER